MVLKCLKYKQYLLRKNGSRAQGAGRRVKGSLKCFFNNRMDAVSFSESNLQLTYWPDIRDAVRHVNPTLATLIDNIDPDKRYPFVKAAYNYGDLIVKERVTYLPDASGQLHSISDSREKNISHQLNYSPIPLFLLLKNASEVFMPFSRPVPLNLFYPGSLLGLFETLDTFFDQKPMPFWNVSAGARNLLILCKLNDAKGLKQLKMAYDIDTHTYQGKLTDQWSIFRAITQHKSFEPVWKNEILFFTRAWLLNRKRDPHWLAFKNYLIAQAWQQVQFALKKVGVNLHWEAFSQTLASRYLKPAPYFVDQIKHILLVAAGHWPAWRTADLSDSVAPISGLQKTIIDIYGLKKYFPSMLYMSSLEKDIDVPLYYSLSVPTLLEGLPHNIVSGTTILYDLKHIKHLMKIVLPVVAQMNKKIDFEYYHVENDQHGEVRSSQELETIDPNLLSGSEQFPDRKFCATSQFWRGCVRIIREPLKEY